MNTLHERIAPRFKRAEVRQRARHYLIGLLSNVERKNGWQLAEQLGERGPQGVQRLLNAACWEADEVRDDLRLYVMEHFGETDGVLIIDETGFLKKGTKSVGVQRQYSGTAGRIENSQIGVFLVYASSEGHTFVDRELYLPKEWAADKERREEAGVPPEIAFATKTQLARRMIERTLQAGLSVAWVTGDEIYGNSGHLRGALEQANQSYVMAVSATHSIWRDAQAEQAKSMMASLPLAAWQCLSAGDGSQGPRLYNWAWVQLPYESVEGMSSWVVARRSLSDPTELAYYRAFGPTGTSLPTLVRIAGQRWTIEEGFESTKSLVGLDQYEVRKWLAWYRHITLVLVAHAYLAVTRQVAHAQEQQKK
ncbi:MAG: IS701 family transposase [Ardenticatenales bacterium]|nr:IS701 family transposase [Ardenticatenales bacterium]